MAVLGQYIQILNASLDQIGLFNAVNNGLDVSRVID